MLTRQFDRHPIHASFVYRQRHLDLCLSQWSGLRFDAWSDWMTFTQDLYLQVVTVL